MTSLRKRGWTRGRLNGFWAIKWKDWGRLSKEFLELQGCAKDDGVALESDTGYVGNRL